MTFRDEHVVRHPELYTSYELQRTKNGFAATTFFDTIVHPNELYAKNPSVIFFRKWRKIPKGKRNSAHPQARVVRGFFGHYPKIERSDIPNKPKAVLKFYWDKKDRSKMYALIDGRTKLIVEKIVMRQPIEWRIEIIEHKTGEISFKFHKSRPALELWQAYFECKGDLIALGSTPLIVTGRDPKQVISDLLGMPLFWYKGFLYSAHDVYRSKKRRGKKKSGIHFALPYKTQSDSPLPQQAVWGMNKNHCPEGQWAWEYWDHLPSATDPHYTSNQ